MNYALSIRDHNVAAHLDIEKEIGLRRNGIFTFTIRVNNGNIVDLNVTEYVDVKNKYAVVKTITIEEFATTPSRWGWGSADTVWYHDL